MRNRGKVILISLAILALATSPTFALQGTQTASGTTGTEVSVTDHSAAGSAAEALVSDHTASDSAARAIAKAAQSAEEAVLASEGGEGSEAGSSSGEGSPVQAGEESISGRSDATGSDSKQSDVIADDADKASEESVNDIGEDSVNDDNATGDEPAEAENAGSDDLEAEVSEENGLTLIAVGRGSLTVDEDGCVSCIPDEGYEVISIIADKDAGEIRKGKQIPELEISEMEFEEDTTVTAVFSRNPEENIPTARPLSAGAAFGL